MKRYDVLEYVENFTLNFLVFAFLIISILSILLLIVLLIMMSNKKIRSKITNVTLRDKKVKKNTKNSDSICYCKRCGKELDIDSIYCKYCGKKQ